MMWTPFTSWQRETPWLKWQTGNHHLEHFGIGCFVYAAFGWWPLVGFTCIAEVVGLLWGENPWSCLCDMAQYLLSPFLLDGNWYLAGADVAVYFLALYKLRFRT